MPWTNKADVKEFLEKHEVPASFHAAMEWLDAHIQSLFNETDVQSISIEFRFPDGNGFGTAVIRAGRTQPGEPSTEWRELGEQPAKRPD